MTNIVITNPPKQIRVLYKPEVNIHLVKTEELAYRMSTDDIDNDTFFTERDDVLDFIQDKLDDEYALFDDADDSYNEDVEVAEDRSSVEEFLVSKLSDEDVQSFLQSNSMYELIKTDNDCFFQLKDEFMKQTYPNETSIN